MPTPPLTLDGKLQSFSRTAKITQDHQKLADEITALCRKSRYSVWKMGSVMKRTNLLDSDIDLFAVIPNSQRNHDANNVMDNLYHTIMDYQPSWGNHSMIVRRDGYGVDVVPAKTTSMIGQYLIPDMNTNNWIKRGHDDFIKEFRRLDHSSNIVGKLSTSVRILKLWRNRKTNLDLSSLSLEKICFDALKTKRNMTLSYTQAVIYCVHELKEQIQKNIKHPSGGPQLNKLDENERKIWTGVLERDMKKFQTENYEEWNELLGWG